MGETIIRMDGIQKWFGGVHALNGAHFELEAGEIHALLGENGAGKSTLIKILAGVYKKDAGVIEVFGKQEEIGNVKRSQELGIVVVHQELNMMPHLTVAENIFIGDEFRSRIPGFLNKQEQSKRAQAVLDSMGLNLSADTKVADLTVAMQQMVEISKAITKQARILVLDEPTSALTESETDSLFQVIRRFQKQGVGIIYISHRLEELKKICDRVTIMRDGAFIAASDIKAISMDEIIAKMVGRAFDANTRYTSGEVVAGEIIMEVKGLNRGRFVQNISFSLKEGEILGFAGLMGAGRTEVARAIFGADDKAEGEIWINGEKVHIHSPYDAVQHGIAYLSEDRKRFGLAPGLSIQRNITMTVGRRLLTRFGFIDSAREESLAEEQKTKMNIKAFGITQLVQDLSGGNQQKVALAKWLVRDCDIIMIDEPTRGIDVGAKAEIYEILVDLKKHGKSIIMISSELPEILRLSDRIIVMSNGRITGELSGNEATQEEIMHMATKFTD